MHVLFHPTYFPNIAHFSAIVKATHITLEAADNFVKQTYRNRAYIYGANGKLSLNIPVVFSQLNRQQYKDVNIYNYENWQAQHWKSLQSAYRKSPFFEYYEDDLKPLFFEEATKLFDFNLKCFKVICNCLQLQLKIDKTTKFKKKYTNVTDIRYLSRVKSNTKFNFENYTQVFHAKHGYISNLSIIDLLCNEGPNALYYLEKQPLPLIV